MPMKQSVIGWRNRILAAICQQALGTAALVLSLVVLANPLVGAQSAKSASDDAETIKLHGELSEKGWIVYSAKTDKGDYDLFVARPNGTEVHNITQTPDYNEFAPQFFPDGTRVLYRRVGDLNPNVDYLQPVFGVLVVANSDGSHPRTLGGEGDFPWATISPNGKQIACLYKRAPDLSFEGKIRIFDLATLKMVKEMPNQGLFQYIRWSGDGKQFCGSGELHGVGEGILTYDLASGRMALISKGLNYAPGWSADSQNCVFSHRNASLASDDGGATAKRIGQDPDESGR